MKTNNDNTNDLTSGPARSTFANTCLATCKKLLARIEKIRTGIAAEFRGQMEEHGHLLDLALNEAETLAWQTGYPQLFFPALALEKAQSVAKWHDRQQSVQRHGSAEMVAA